MERIVGILKFMKVVYPHQVDTDINVECENGKLVITAVSK